jgi:hypothetical protein
VPDLFAHFASGYLPGNSRPGLRFDALLVTGTILPDLLTRVPEIFLDRFLGFSVYHFFNALHTPAGLGLFCYLLCLFFPAEGRSTVFTSLFAGSMLHFILDLMQAQFYNGVYMPFFPLSLETMQWGLFHYNSSLYLFPLLLLLTITTYWRRKAKEPKKK